MAESKTNFSLVRLCYISYIYKACVCVCVCVCVYIYIYTHIYINIYKACAS